MIPIKLSISGFLSYRDPVEIDFTNIQLACIAGYNGAGKSSILDAITWGLFGQARRRDDAVINTQSETAEVSLIFEYESNIYRVIRSNTRGKTTRLELQIATGKGGILSKDPQTMDDNPVSGSGPYSWKTLTENSLRATQAALEDTLRLDYETFVNAAFFLQGKADQFTQQRPGDRKRILSTILGLEIWDVYRARTVERRKSVDAEMVAIDGRLMEINAELAEESSRRTRLAELEGDLDGVMQARVVQESALENIKQVAATLAEQRKLVDAHFNQLKSNQNRLADHEARLESRKEEIKGHKQVISRGSEIEASYQSWVQARDALMHWNEVAEQFREHEKRREGPLLAIESERSRLVQEAENLKGQETTINELLSTMDGYQKNASELQASIETLQVALEDRKNLETELAAALENLANAKAENPRLKAEMDEIKSRIDTLNQTEGAACPLCGQPLRIGERRNLVDELELVGKALGDKYRANQKTFDTTDTQVKDLKSGMNRLAHLDNELLEHKDQLNKTNTRLEQIQAQEKTWNQEGAPRLKEIISILEAESYAQEARTVLAEIDAELKEIGYDAVEHDTIRRVELDGRSAEEEFRSLERAKAALEPLEDEFANLQSQMETLRAEVSAQQAEYDQEAANLAAAEAQAPDIQQAQRSLLDIKERENQLRLEVGAASQKVMVLDDLKIRRDALEAERESLAQVVSQYKQLERAFGKDGVPALLIESALPQIESKANEILERLSGGGMSIHFITQRKYKDKRRDDLRETLDIQISDNAGVREYEMFSGGEAFRVNFAIRLALSEILAQRAGARMQTLVIDEGFGSQDEVGRQRLIETINIVQSDFARILVITHIESMKEAFPNRIEVEKTPRGSVVTVL
jgi:exonuclease SbcC